MNIVFDLGGVVLHWNPDELIARTFSGKSDQKIVKEQFLSHPDWEAMDKGTLDEESALQNAAQRTALPYEKLKKMMEDVPPFLEPNSQTIAIIKKVKERGHKLYILSNMHHNSMDYLLATHDFFNMFDGIVASCRVGMIKPEPEIYEHLLKEFSLNPEETAFIDDLKQNVEAASKKGIHPIHFIDPEQCEEALKEIHCL
ncbi:HAD family phosphatase [Oceanispirochaeta crateris]|uniref:HAD family phosphatase n=1 Tax=Oceanispirochaeta crateris TaxID=2518645 RepID=A0A5C1QM24_9SPIO|nr:HAD family phosphatase [Oceanispirochaeta crateris]QEN08701.1 HAD family phosphatase [Oceanispirochaeta crateris]